MGEEEIQMTYMRQWAYITMVIVMFSSCGSNDNSIKTEKISNYVQNGGVELSEQDYLDAGISGITAENLGQINEAIAAHIPSEIDTKRELQTIITKEIGIEKIAAYVANGGELPTLKDYINAGISSITVENLAQINTKITTLIQSDMHTNAELQAIIIKEIAKDKIATYAKNIGEALTLQDYLDAGISGVTAENLTQMNATVAGLSRYKHKSRVLSYNQLKR